MNTPSNDEGNGINNSTRADDLKAGLLFLVLGIVPILFFFNISDSYTGELFQALGNSWYLLVVGIGLIIAAFTRFFSALTSKPEDSDVDAFRCSHCREIIPIINIPMDGSGFACPHCGEWIG
jgi:hypothetical protein